MTAETVLHLISYILLIFIVVAIHEMIHLLFARVFRRRPTVKLDRFLTPIVRYENNQNDWQNLIIAASAPAILFSFGIWIEGDGGGWVLVKILCLSNVFNFFPVTTDGQMILLSCLRIIRKEQRRNDAL